MSPWPSQTSPHLSSDLLTHLLIPGYPCYAFLCQGGPRAFAFAVLCATSFPQMSAWFSAFPTACLCSHVTFSVRLSLVILCKIVIPITIPVPSPHLLTLSLWPLLSPETTRTSLVCLLSLEWNLCEDRNFGLFFLASPPEARLVLSRCSANAYGMKE